MALKAVKLDSTETVRVGIREFRENFASFLGSFDKPVAITRHGETVGYYIPTRPRRSENEKAALTQALSRLHEVLAANGISSEEIIQEFKRTQAGQAQAEQTHEVSEAASAEQGA
jgi:antitoxin (DNA-binding transcriptional repressor) of toxin-antitoxin stability system